MEIYVSTGPDGIEIFSNLPRGARDAQSLPDKANRAPQGRNQPTLAQWHPVDNMPFADANPVDEAISSGKSFLLDD